MGNKLTDNDRQDLIMDYLEEYEHYIRFMRPVAPPEGQDYREDYEQEIDDIHQAICTYCKLHPLGYRYLNHADAMRTEMYIQNLLLLKERQLQDLTDSELCSFDS